MLDHLQQPDSKRREQFRQYLAEVETLVAEAAPDVRDDGVFLGRLHDLLPSRTRSAQHLTPADWDWLEALRQVTQRHQISYELVACTEEDDSLRLVPPH